MTIKSFFLLGEDASTAQEIEVDFTHDIDTLKEDVGQYFGVAAPSGEYEGILDRHLVLNYHFQELPSNREKHNWLTSPMSRKQSRPLASR
jgi:hypothetical protein